MRALKRAAAAALLLLLVLAAILAAGGWWALGTTAGSDWLLREGARRGAVALDYAALRGSLLHGMELDELDVDTGGTRVQVHRLVLGWQARELLSRRLVIDELSAHRVVVHTPPAPADGGEEPHIAVPELPAVKIPLAVQVARLELREVRLQAADAPPVLDALGLALEAAGEEVRIRGLELQARGVSVTGTLAARTHGDWPLEGELAVSGSAGDTELDLATTLGGYARLPQLEVIAALPVTATGRLRADLRRHPPQASLELAWKDAAHPAAAPLASPEGSAALVLGEALGFSVKLDTRLSGAPAGLSQVALDASGRLASLGAPYRVEADVHWQVQAQAGAFAGDGRVAGDAGAIELDHRLTAPFRLTTRGSVRPQGLDTHVDLAGEWHDLTWPPGAADGPASPEGRYEVRGSAADLRAQVRAALARAGGVQALEVALSGGAATSPPHAFQARLDWRVQAQPGTFAGSGRAAGDAGAIELDHELTAPFRLTTRGSVLPRGPDTRVDLAGEWRDLAWPPGAADGPASPEGRYALRGSAADLQAQVRAALARAGGVQSLEVDLAGGAAIAPPHAFKAQLDWRALTELAGAVQGAGSAEGDAQRVRFSHRLSGPGQLQVQGVATLAPALALEVDGGWQDLRWPLQDTAVATSPRGSFAVAGPLDALVTRVQALADATPVGPVELRASATVGPTRARDLDLEAKLLEGTVTATGQVGWGEALSAALQLRAAGINPARFHAQAAGKLDAHLAVDVQLRGAAPSGRVQLHALDGELGGYPVRGQGQLTLDEGRFDARQVSLRTGDNTLDLSGSVGETLDLRYRVDAPALAQLWPGLAGSVKGEGLVRGTASAPAVKATLQARALRAGEARVNAASLDADLDLGQERRSTITASAEGIAAGGQQVSSARLALQGSRSDHRLELAADADLGRLALAARGALEGESWQGQLRELSALGTPLGDWRLAAPVPLTVDRGGAGSGEACLRSDPARLCVQATRGADRLQRLRVALSKLAVARFSPWLPPDVKVTGDIDAVASAAATPRGAWTAEATVTATPTRITLPETLAPSASAAPLTLSVDDTRLEARHGPEGSVARLASRLAGDGRVRGEVRVGPAGGAGAPSLAGTVDASLPDLSPLNALVPAVADLAGRLDARVTLSGTLQRPGVQGSLDLRDGRATVAAAGITVERTELQLEGNADGRFSVQGRTHSGPGSIAITGAGRIADDGWSAQLSAVGENFEAVKLIPVHAMVSPKLELRADPAQIAVTGSLHVPTATVTIQELPPNVVAVSDDETIVGREPRSASVWRNKLQVAVDLTLGEAVHVSAFGLDTGLAGGLAIGVDGAAPATARGTVSLVGGRFTAYGQDLQVRRGRLLFAGPLDNPGLDLRAVRDAGEVQAGIEISGTAERMRSRVFSEPPLPQAEALAWLLTGRPLSGASSADGTALAGAAVALGLERSDQVTRQIGTALGLDELTVAPGDSLDSSALVLGKSITPKLYIRYALGLLDRQGSVQLDYKITDRISVEAESGTRHGADVIYRLER